MNHILETYNGKYFISFFTIEVETDIEPEKMIELENINTIFHEYIHFLQDISTTFGLINISKNSDEIANFYNTKKDSCIEIPFKSHQSDITKTNNDLFSLYLNSDKHKNLPKDPLDLNVKSEKFSYIEGFTNLYEHSLHIKKETWEDSVSFGAIAIMESMAAIIETHFFPENKNIYVHPYDTAYLIVKSIYPELAEDNIMVFSICDASLMYYDPADVFINILKLMKEENYKPKNYNDIYDFFIRNVQFQGLGFWDMVNQAYTSALNGVTNIINSSHFNYSREWISTLLNNFNNLRMRNIGFLAEIMLKNKNEGLIEFLNLMKSSGTPIIINLKGEASNIIDNEKEMDGDKYKQLFYWPALKGLVEQLFHTGNVQCPITKICDKQFEICSTKPWDRDKENLCLYNQLYKMLGLEGKSLWSQN